MFKKIFIGLIVLAVLAFAGLSFYVSTIDWNLHKAKIAAQIEDLTGKRVVFDGDVDLSFFPRPYLSAKNIKIYNQTGENTVTPLAVIKEMVTDLSLGPLLNGNFEIDNMTLQDANILVEFMKDGRLNWYSEISDSQRDNLNNVEVALNSVMLKNATVEIVNPGLGIDVTLQNLNAEVTAQSLYGPYRIDGNFIKDNNPAGFALNLGTLSESFGTTLNLVLTHPTTESYACFDGQMLSNNSEVEGEFTVESQNPAKFLNELTNQIIMPLEFNYPFQGSVNLKVNPQQVDLSGLVVKYGDITAGAGNVLIPLVPLKGQERRKVEFTFDFTNLDLMPVAGVLKQFIQKYDHAKTPFMPEFDYDLTANVKAVKAFYNDEEIRNFNFSLELVNDIFSVKNLSGLLPGDTDVTVAGDVFENDKVLSYDLKLNAVSQDLFKFLTWVDLKPETYAPSTYRGSQVSTRLSGTLNQIKIAPLTFSIDNNQASGMIGIIRDKRTQLFVVLNSEKVNFDNYLPQLTDEEQKLSFIEKVKLTLNRLSFMNKYDIHFESKLNVGIYNKTPFENLEINFDSKDEVVQINKLHIDEIAASTIDLTGKLSGLGANPAVENMKYDFKTDKFSSFRNSFDIPLPQWPLFQNAQKIRASGILTGNTDMVTIKAVTNVDDSFFKSVYTGKLFNQNNNLNFRGRLEFNTEFVKFINSLGFNYRPRNFASAVFTFKGIVSGNPDNWSAQEINSYVSSNNFEGSANVEIREGRPVIKAELSTNRFEFDRLIYNPGRQNVRVLSKTERDVPFLAKPQPENVNIDYELYKTFDLSGKFQAKVLNYETETFSNASATVEIKNGVIGVRGFQAEYGADIGERSPVSASFEIDATNDPRVKGFAQISSYQLENFGGNKYNVEKGTLKARLDFDAPAHSQMAFFESLSGKLSFDVENALVKGWNLKRPEADLSKRDTSDGLFEMLRDSLESGTTEFDLIGSEIELKKGDYTLKNTLFSNNYATVEANGKGNLKNWDGDIAFTLTYEQLKDKIMPLHFDWKGNLADPTLKVDVSELKNKYDSHWAQIAKEKQDAENARIEALQNAMAQAQEIVVDLTETVEKDIRPLIDKHKPQSHDAEVKSIYDSNLMQLIDIHNQLLAMADKAKQDYTMDDVNDMNVRLETLEPLLTEILRRVNENIKTDTVRHAGDEYKNIINIYDNSRDKSVNYQKTLTAYAMRLLQLKSLVLLDRDPRVLDYKNGIETSMREIEDLRGQSRSAREAIEDSDSLDEIDVKYKVLQELHQKSERALEELNSEMEGLFDYAQKLVREEESRGKRLPVQPAEDQNAPSAADREPEIPAPVAEENKAQPVETPSSANTDVEPVAEPVVIAEPEALIKPLEENSGDLVTYSSRAVLSGRVNKSKPRALQTPNGSNNSGGSLLRPIQGDTGLVSGTIQRKNK